MYEWSNGLSKRVPLLEKLENNKGGEFYYTVKRLVAEYHLVFFKKHWEKDLRGKRRKSI